jgi:tetratricopeptide (TPR) repeat protein
MAGDQAAAERTFLHATQIGDNSSRIRAHSNLARLYMAQGRRDAARVQFEFAIESEENPATRAYRRGLMLVQLYPGDREQLLAARAHFEEALRLQPRLALAIDALERVDRSLERLE